MLSQTLIAETFIYSGGKLFWRHDSGKVKAGQRSGWDAKNYHMIQFEGQVYYEHILVWVLYNGPVPDGMFVDHVKPEDSLNNKIENLRLASRSENNCNRRVFKNNKSGVKGVRWLPRDKLWQVRVTHQGKVHYGGCFSDLQDATEAIKELREKLHGQFTNHG